MEASFEQTDLTDLTAGLAALERALAGLPAVISS